MSPLEWLLRLSALAQLGVAAINFSTARLLKWQVYGGMSVSYLVAASRWFGRVGG